MHPRNPIIIAAWLVLAAFGVASCQAAELDSQAYKKIAAVLTEISPGPVILEKSGILIDPTYDSGTTADLQQLARQYDTLILPTFFWTNSGKSLYDVYKAILLSGEWASVPLDSIQRKNLKSSSDLLYAPTGNGYSTGYQNYLNLKAIYEKAEAALDAQPPDNIDPVVQNARDQAETNLDLKGHRQIYEPAEETYVSLTKQAAYGWRDVDAKTLQAVDPTISALSIPTPEFDKIPVAGWVHIDLTGDAIAQDDSSPVFSNSLTSSNTPVWWTASPSIDGQSISCLHFPSGKVDVSFDVSVLALQRSWYDPKVISSQSWRWKNSSGLISDGKLENNSGLYPLLPVSVLVIKNLEISGSGISNCIDMVRQAIRSKMNVMFGPFSLASTASGGSFFLPPIIANGTIAVPFSQIIGVSVSVLPMSPNPNSDFLWPQ